MRVIFFVLIHSWFDWIDCMYDRRCLQRGAGDVGVAFTMYSHPHLCLGVAAVFARVLTPFLRGWRKIGSRPASLFMLLGNSAVAVLYMTMQKRRGGTAGVHNKSLGPCRVARPSATCRRWGGRGAAPPASRAGRPHAAPPRGPCRQWWCCGFSRRALATAPRLTRMRPPERHPPPLPLAAGGQETAPGGPPSDPPPPPLPSLSCRPPPPNNDASAAPRGEH